MKKPDQPAGLFHVGARKPGPLARRAGLQRAG
jgi:hypothetical protein